MKGIERVKDEELQAFIDQGRAIGRASDLARARLLARARAALADEPAPSSTAKIALPRLRPGVQVLIAVTVPFVVGAGAVAALHSRWVLADPPEAASVPTPETSTARRSATDTISSKRPMSSHESGARLRQARMSMSPHESYKAELDLLERAEFEYAGGNYVGALELVATHARRFSAGRLAEEREALRVRFLAGADQGSEARHALTSFEKRYPRSVLLPHLHEMVRSAED